MAEEIRWKQRFKNFEKALSQLKKFIDKFQDLNELEKQGMIQAFEYTFELGWNVLKDFLEFQGNQNIYGSRSAIQEAFRYGLIEDGEGWMEMFSARNKTSHTYNENLAEEISQFIEQKAFLLFTKLQAKMSKLL